MIFALMLIFNFCTIDLLASKANSINSSSKLLSNIDFIESNNSSKQLTCCEDKNFSLKRLCMVTTCALSVTITTTVLSGLAYITIHDLAHDIKQGIYQARHDIDTLGEKLDKGFLDMLKDCTNNSLTNVNNSKSKK
jgi:hypothetical protein